MENIMIDLNILITFSLKLITTFIDRRNKVQLEYIF